MEENQQKFFCRAKPLSPEDEICISGISGRFPNSRNMYEFAHNLYNKIDMVDDAETRWRYANSEIPKRMGKVSDLEYFDANFFGVHYKQAHTMDPQTRLLIEHAHEAVLDAGINPRSIRGSRTGVFIGACFAESDKVWFYEKIASEGFGITGCSRAMMANRISYTLGINGPSHLVDTACSSSMYALDVAYNSIRNGECDAALIGGSNLLLHPYTTLQFARLGVLSPEGYCRPFDKDANGYVRAEAICVIYLQKAKDAKRIYAKLLHSKTNCDGYKEEGITYPAGRMQAQLLSEFYKEININPATVDFVEAHSTGTVVGDPEECNALDKVFCTGRNKPLPVGSVKSNIGHSESTSGACSVAKCVIMLENDMVPPNINFSEIRPGIPSLQEGRLAVVSELIKCPGKLVGINSFGFGGANAHALLHGNTKEKINKGLPEDDLPRLVVWSGRTEESVNVIFDDLCKRPLDAEYVALLHNIQNEPIPKNVFRGYAVFSKNGEEPATCFGRDAQHYTGLKRPLVWVYSGMGSQWTEMGATLMNIPLFRAAIEKCQTVLKPKGLDLIKIITSPEEKFANILHSFVGIAAIQIGLTDILKDLGIEPDFIIGHSVGELGCAYADGCFTAEQMILSAYSRGMASLETNVVHGSMAAVGWGYRKIRNILPNGIEVACHNSSDSCTISGPAENVSNFVAELKAKEIFAKEVPCSNIPYHSKYIADMGPRLLARLNEVIPEAKKRSPKWLSSSVPKSKWDLEESQYSSAYYHTNNLLSPVLFEETSSLLPSNSLTIEIAPHGLLQAILKMSLATSVHIGLTQRGHKDNVRYFYAALGKLYMNGLDIPVSKLYPPVQFPVGRGTPMISPLIKWDHGDEYFVMKFSDQRSRKSGERKVGIALSNQDFKYIAGHTIDGRVLFPATGYLCLAWETLAMMKGFMNFDISVEFEDVKFLRATPVPTEKEIELTVMVQSGTGRFEISEGSTAVVTGYIRQVDDLVLDKIPEPESSDQPILDTRDFYKELRLRGYHYSGLFKSVLSARGDGKTGVIKWDANWIAFMDCLLQVNIIARDTRSLMVPTAIQKLRVNPSTHLGLAASMGEVDNQMFTFNTSEVLNTIQCGGIEISGVQANVIGRRKPPGDPVLESYAFIPHLQTPKMNNVNAARIFVQLALENKPTLKVKVIEIQSEGEVEPFIDNFQHALGDLPLVTADLMLFTQKEHDLPGVQVEDGKLSTQNNVMFIIETNCLSKPELLEAATTSLMESGFVLSREGLDLKISDITAPQGYQVVVCVPTENELLVLLQHNKKKLINPTIIKIKSNDQEYSWLEQLKEARKTGPVIMVSQNDPNSGILGLVNCMRKEPDGHLISCVFIDDDSVPEFDMEDPLHRSYLKLGLAINVVRDGKWGSYRHLLLEETLSEQKRHDHCYANLLTRGDLSSISWLGGPFNQVLPNNELVKIVYSSLNFRDIMLATGKLSADIVTTNRFEQECVLGLEYAGVTASGKRVMGMVNCGALSTHVECDSSLMWECPDDWTLEEAATVPVVYSTVYSALFITGRISKGKSILIHAGTGGIGLSAIRVALAYGLEVFTTVSTPAKKDYLLELFPQLKVENIGNSRDTSFKKMIMLRTNGKGVDFVLNSLAEEKLQASMQCLGQGGKFLEIGKFDMANDSKLGMNQFLKELSFHAILVDNMFKASKREKASLKELIMEDIRSGIIKPLKTNVFKANEIEQAFRFLASGKHMGKVIIKLRESDNDNETMPIKVLPKIYCNSDFSYIIPGGLGGFGLELADWLVMRRCRKLVLSSSRGISRPYQAYRIKTWENYGVQVVVSTADIRTREGCEQLIHQAINLGPVGGIFNLAVVLRDNILENQSVEKFIESMGPKADATKHLDALSRKMCPYLSHFVVFSSVSCGRGNAGQTNYGMSNSIMERIIEHRHNNGLPAKAIQWGAVGEVGLVADMAEGKMDMEIGGTLQQRISSCLEVLDTLLNTPEPIVASMVVAEKHGRGSGSGDIIETVKNILGIRDIKQVSMDTTLSEMGMDSMMAVEIKQALEREFDLNLTPQDLRSLTFMKLQEYQESRNTSTETVRLRLANYETPTGVAMLIRNLGDETHSDQTILRLHSEDNEDKYKLCVLMTPGVEGVCGTSWSTIASHLTFPTFMLQLMKTIDKTTVPEICQEIFEDVKNQVFATTERFFLVGYSFGALISLELARMLEETGMEGYVLIIDGSPDFLHKLAMDHMAENDNDEIVQQIMLTGIVQLIFPGENIDIQAIFTECTTWDSRIDKILEFGKDHMSYSPNYLRNMANALFNRIKISMNLDIDNFTPINSSITLIRPTEFSVADIDEDYGLAKYTKGKISQKFIEGNHITVLENPKLPQLINEVRIHLEDKNPTYTDAELGF